MASTLQQDVTSIQMNNYSALVILTAVGYDFVLTFSNEIEYIWNQRWTRVSTLFVLARYVGLYTAIIYAIVGSSFLPGPAKVISHASDAQKILKTFNYCQILAILNLWTTMIFIGAADLAMILRVCALYSRSKFILGILFSVYAVEMLPYLVFCIWYSTQRGPNADVAQVLDFSYCANLIATSSPVWDLLQNGAQMALGTLLCLFVVIQFIREAFVMYRATKCFRLNRYMNLFVWEGMIYFLAIQTYSLINLLIDTGKVSTSESLAILYVGEYVLPFTLVPRFILSLRELYARDLRGVRGGGNDVDTAFGFTLSSGHGAAASTIMFADDVRNQDEEIQMEDREISDPSGGNSV